MIHKVPSTIPVHAPASVPIPSCECPTTSLQSNRKALIPENRHTPLPSPTIPTIVRFLLNTAASNIAASFSYTLPVLPRAPRHAATRDCPTPPIAQDPLHIVQTYNDP